MEEGGGVGERVAVTSPVLFRVSIRVAMCVRARDLVTVGSGQGARRSDALNRKIARVAAC